MQADLEQVQRKLDRVESLQSERDIVPHIDQLRRKVKRNAREDDENAPEPKRTHDAEPEFPALRESMPITPRMPVQPAEVPLPLPVASPKRSRPKPPPPHARSPVPATPPIGDNVLFLQVLRKSQTVKADATPGVRRRPAPQWSQWYQPLMPIQF